MDTFDTSYRTRRNFDNQIADGTKRLKLKVAKLITKIENQQNYITDYHNTFDTLYRASERVRHQQKYQFIEQAKTAQIAFNEQLDEAVNSRYTHISMNNVIEFAPQAIEVDDDIERYFQIAAETGKPFFEVIPPTLLAEAIHKFSSSSSEGGGSDAHQYTTSGVSTSDEEIIIARKGFGVTNEFYPVGDSSSYPTSNDSTSGGRSYPTSNSSTSGDKGSSSGYRDYPTTSSSGSSERSFPSNGSSRSSNNSVTGD
jgi:hypothetical protein